MIDKGTMLLDGWRGVFWRGPKEKLLGGELTRQTASSRSLLSCWWGGESVLMGSRKWLVVFQHANQW